MNGNDVLTTGRFAKIMKVSSVTVINWTRKSGLPSHRIGRGPRRITVKDAREFLSENDYPIPVELQEEPSKKAVRVR